MKENTLQLLKASQKITHMDCWEALYTYIQASHQQKVLIDEQKFSDTSPVFGLAEITNTPWLEP
jgi:hypothetical protein